MVRRPRTFLILFALWLLVFSASSQVVIVAPILPEIGAALDISEALQGSLVSVYALMLSVFALISGPFSDKLGRRTVLIAGSFSMFVALLLHGVAGNYLALLTVRALAGAAGGMLSGAAVAFVADYFPYERRGWANGWVMSGIAFGQIVGIPLGTLLAGLFDYRWPFLMFAGTMGLAAGLIWWGVPQPSVARKEEKLTLRGVLTDYAHLLRKRETGAASAAYFLMFFSVGLYIVYLPTWLVQELTVTQAQIASLFLVGGIVNVITGPLAGRISDTVGRKPLVVWSCVGLGVVMLVTSFIVRDLFVAYIIFGTAMMMVSMRISPLQTLMTALVAPERRGVLMSLAIAIGQFGVAIGAMLAGFAYTEYGYVSNTLLGAVAIMAMALLVHRALPEPTLAKAKVKIVSIPENKRASNSVG